MTVTCPFRPNPGQERFLASRAPRKLACSGVGGGKSAVGAVDFLVACLDNAPAPGMVLSPTYDMLKLNTIPPILEWWPEGIFEDDTLRRVIGKQKMEGFDLRLVNGVTIYFRSAEQPEHLRGPNIGQAWLDEAAQMRKDIFTVILGRVRVRCRWPSMRLTTTPRGVQSWLHDKWVVNPKRGYELHHWPTDENAGNLRDGFLDDLEVLDPLMVAQERRGEFVDLSGTSKLDYRRLLRCERDGLPKMHGGAELYLGVDVGRKRDLTVFWGLYRLGEMWMTGVLRVMEKQPFSVQEAALDSLMPSVVHCCVDATGIGAQIAERAQERWGEARVTPVTFTAPSKSAMAARVEAAVDADTLRIPRDEVVRRDLLSVTKEVSERGIVRLHAPASPDGHADRFWALALAMEAADAHPPVELTWMDEDGESEDAHFVELMG